MNFNVLHQRLLQDVLEVGKGLPLVLTGGYAVQAHGLVDRLSRDIDVATNSNVPMDVIAAALIDGLAQRVGLATRLEAADWYEDQAFAEYGVSVEDIADLRRWAQGWADDIRRRLYAENFDFDEDDQ